MRLNEAHQEIITDLIEKLDLHHIIDGADLADLTWEEYKQIVELLETIRDTKEMLNFVNE